MPSPTGGESEKSEPVTGKGRLPKALKRPCHDGQGEGNAEVAEADLQQEVRHHFSPPSVRPSRIFRSRSISLREIFFPSTRWVISGAREPPVSLSASDSS